MKHGVGIQLFEVKRLACPIGQQREECQLRTTVAFAKSVDRIQFGEKMSSLLGKLLRR
jgi:hypothetical protein